MKIRKLHLDPGIQAQRQEASILCNAKEEIDSMVLAPGHDRLAAETRVGADDGSALRPTGANPRDDPAQLLDTPQPGDPKVG